MTVKVPLGIYVVNLFKGPVKLTLYV